MIPSDLTARLRSMMESAVHPLTALKEIAGGLPEFRPGSRFTATVQTPLPDGTFKAIVAGKSVVLSMPQSAKAGDTVELVTVERTPRMIVATTLGAQVGALRDTPGTTLSRGAQVIGNLLAHSDDLSTKAAPLARNLPILSQPPATGRNLAPLLQAAIAESGVFYEAHQALWVTGQFALDSLLREPQGRQGWNRHQGPDNLWQRDASTAGANGSTPQPALTLLVRAADGEIVRQAVPPEGAQTTAANHMSSPGLPTDLVPVVRQQLDALSNQHVLWVGQVWPGQTMEWEIDDPTQHRSADAREPQAWKTTLRLALPRLGSVVATLVLDTSGVALDLRVSETDSADALRGRIADLASALKAVGVPLRSMQVDHGAAD
jgi:hypothetical protein